MLINTFTLIDAFNQFWKACEDGDRRALTCTGLTYFYFCRCWNTSGRSISFRRQNQLICAELNISSPTLINHRNILKQCGLIDFYSKGKGDPEITYKILELRTKKEVVKNENNFTSDFTSDLTSDLTYKQSKSIEGELFVVIEAEAKNFYYLKNLFEADVGLTMDYAQKGLPPGKFSDAVEKWMIQNNGSEYKDFQKARRHFLFWMPNYQYLNEQKNNGKTKSIPTPGKKSGNSSYAGGF